MLIRPVRTDDHPKILQLAKQAGIGMLSLPPDAVVLERKIACSVASFNGEAEREEESFLMVLEDTESGELVGTTGVIAHVGLTLPFYSYKLSTVVQTNEALGIYSQLQVLHMVNDYTGATEIGSLFLLPEYRKDGLGRFLSRCRYLLLAEFPQLFSDTVIAEIRGVNDAEGNAPFYDHLVRPFFKLPYAEADYISATKGNQFIADLMPKYPIYVNLLPREAQRVIGKPLPDSEAAMKLLIREGFSYQGYIDIFDAGPTLQADFRHIRGIQASRKVHVSRIVEHIDVERAYMLCNTKLEAFRICHNGMRVEEDGSVTLSRTAAEKLEVGEGHAIRYTPT